MKKIFLILSLISSFTVFSQTLYTLNEFGKFKSYDQSYQATLIKSFDISLADVAVSSLGEYYFLSAYNIYKYDVATDQMDLIRSFPASTGYCKSLTAGDNNELYLLTDFGNLCRYSISTDTFDIITNIGFQTPGDLVFYEGNIIFPASGTDFIKAYNLQTGALTNIFCLPSNFLAFVYGIATHYNSCGENVVILSKDSSLYEIDFENEDLIELTMTNNTEIYGIASDSEFLASNCNAILENNICSLSVDDYNFLNLDVIFYPNPVNNVITIKNNVAFTSLTVIDIQGKIILKSDLKETDVSALTEGVYFLLIENGTQSRYEKFIKR